MIKELYYLAAPQAPYLTVPRHPGWESLLSTSLSLSCRLDSNKLLMLLLLSLLLLHPKHVFVDFPRQKSEKFFFLKRTEIILAILEIEIKAKIFIITSKAKKKNSSFVREVQNDLPVVENRNFP